MNHLKYLLLLFCSLTLSYKAIGMQVYGNEWIDYDKVYYKITTAQTGMHRISFQELDNAGFPVFSVDPRNIQIFYRGQEQAIFISGEEDGVFDNQDFIEFYGQQNDGTLDAFFYNDPANQTNPFANLYSNRSAYFLSFTLDGSRGRRIEALNLSNEGLAPEPFYTHEEIMHFRNLNPGENAGQFAARFNRGQILPTSNQSQTNGAFNSDFVTAKGFTDVVAGGNTKRNYKIMTPNVYRAGGQPTLEVRMTGWSNTPHTVDILVGPNVNSQRKVGTITFNNYSNGVLAVPLEGNDLSADSVFVSYQIVQTTGNNERAALSTIRLTYPRLTNAQQAEELLMRIPPKAGGQARLVVSNTPASSRLFDITDRANIKLLSDRVQAGTLSGVIPNANGQRTLWLDTRIRQVENVAAARMEQFNPRNFTYIIISHPNLMRPAGGFDDAVAAYAEYRNSQAGGGYKVLTLSVEDVYDQFTFGEVTPLAIRRLSRYLVERGTPLFLFLIGKGLDITYDYENNKPASIAWTQQSLVPCYGAPCSDMLFTTGLGNALPLEPAIPVGRLSCMNPAQVIAYLNKIKEYEAYNFDDLWKKRLLHLSGGKTNTEYQLFRRYVDSFKDVATGLYKGSQVETISKTSTRAVEFIDVTAQINQGINLLTFFGHAGLTVTDIDIGYVTDPLLGYDNKGKYPFIFMNGCGAGNIWTTASTSFGENWLNAADRGAVLFTAHSHLGYTNNLFAYSTIFYRNAFATKELVNQPIGNIMRQVDKEISQRFLSNPLSVANSQQFILQGDPALRIFNASLPDYGIKSEEIFVNADQIITSRTESFELGIPISNFGLIDSDEGIEVSVKRRFTNGQERTYGPVIIPPITFKDTVFIPIIARPGDEAISAGNNIFEIVIDGQNIIEEEREENNTAQFNLFVARGTMEILRPRRFSIVNSQPVTFFAQNTDLFSEDRAYIFQLDTTDTFSSPAFRDTTVLAGLTPTWTTALLSDNNRDSTVYYLRVRYADFRAQDDTVWANSSFVYIKDGTEGWSQSHFPQYKENGTVRIAKAEAARRWDFITDDVVVKARTVGGLFPNWRNYSVSINEREVVFGGNCGQNRILFIAFDGKTGAPYLPLPDANVFQLSLICGFGTPGVATWLTNDYIRRFNAINTILSRVNEGDYLLIMTTGNFSFQALQTREFNILKGFGIDTDLLLESIQPGDPYIAFARKGDPVGAAIQIFPQGPEENTIPSNQQTISGEFGIDLGNASGSITSPLIGPARQWFSNNHLFTNKETQADRAVVDLIGADLNGNESILRENMSPGEDLSDINPSQYPFLRLQVQLEDTARQTPAQLYHWQVYYEEVPEGILFYDSITSNFQQPPVFQEGDSAKFQFVYRNIASTDFLDSMVVIYRLENETVNRQLVIRDTLKPVASGDSLKLRINYSTIGWVGRNRLNVTVNPRIQSEQVYYNNTLEVAFEVKPDETHPILDVVFDGRRIMDGELVSPSPIITVSVKDENKFLIRQDTTGIEMFLNECDSCTLRKIPFSDPRVSWQTSENNNFLVNYQPDKLINGQYTFVVQASDVSGNRSGLLPYQVRFEVVNESSITNFYPYPNPFSDNVRFVFTLTGSQIPDRIKIQIMTVSGKVVREIMPEEIGPIRVGNNMTEYAWDGRDEYGSQLGNGVYLYRVVMEGNTEEMKRMETAGDNLFKKGYGKLYLMR